MSRSRRPSTTAVIISVVGFLTFVAGAFLAIVATPTLPAMASAGIIALVGLGVLAVAMRVI